MSVPLLLSMNAYLQEQWAYTFLRNRRVENRKGFFLILFSSMWAFLLKKKRGQGLVISSNAGLEGEMLNVK